MKSIGCFKKCEQCQEGIWIDEDKSYFKKWLNKYKEIRTFLEADKWRKKSSKHQRGYMFGVIVKKFSDHIGMFPDEAYEYLMNKFLPVDRVGNDGRIYKTRMSYNALSTLEAEELHEKIRIYAITDHQLYIPLPNEPQRTL